MVFIDFVLEEMERFWHLRSSRGGEKPCHGRGLARRSNSVLKDRVHVEGSVPGNVCAGKQIDMTNVVVGSKCTRSNLSEGNSFTVELMQNSSKKASIAPIKTLIAAEMLIETESRKRSPSVIARLMGLDPLPPHHPVHSQRRLSEIHSQTPPVMFQESHICGENRSLWKNCNTKDSQEFKDVYEVLENSRAEIHNDKTAKKVPVKSRVKEEKMAFIRQKFMDAKRLSTDENLRHSKEFRDALEVLDSNKDLFLKILHGPDSLFAKHLHNLQSSAHSSHITVLKSSKATKHENGDSCCKLERKIEGNLQPGRHSVCPSHRLPKSQSDVKVEPSHLPTRIVVLKPSMEKTQNSAKDTSLPNLTASPYVSCRKHRESRRTANRDLFPELRRQSKLPHTVEPVGQKPKGSREIAKEITKQMRQSANGVFMSNESSPGRSDFAPYESLCKLPIKGNLNDFEDLNSNTRRYCDWDIRYSPTDSSESYVSREAKRRLSCRWKMTHSCQEVRSVSRGTNTLGEMLALHDREPEHASVGDPSRDRLERCPCPLGISSRDGWKDGHLRILPKSRSVPASSTLYESPKMRIRPGSFDNDNHSLVKEITIVNPEKRLNRNFFDSEKYSSKSARFPSRISKSVLLAGMDSDHLVKEIHVMPDVLTRVPEETPQPEEMSQDLKQFLGSDCILSDLSGKIQASECKDSNTPFRTEEEKMPEPSCIIMDVTERDSVIYDQNNLILQDSCAEHSPFMSRSDVKESESPQNSKGAEQPSPVSVLEPPFEEETSCSSECFERVSADLHGLRMQLQLLKLESAGECTDRSEFSVSSDEDYGEGFESSYEERRELSGVFSHKENQDFSSILDVLVSSGLLATDQEMLFATCYSSETPIAPGLVEKLEKKYGEQSEWPKPERKLLFDRINCGLAEILGPCMDRRPWVKSNERRVQVGWSSEALAEEVWQLLSKQAKEGSLGSAESALGGDVRWMDLADDIDMIGRELEKFLIDELMEEVVAGF